MERSMSVTIGGTAPNPCKRGGSWSLDAGSGGIVAVFSMWNLPPSRHQVQIEPSRFVVSTTTPKSRTREPDHAQVAPPAPFGGWHRDRSSARCAGPGDP